MQRSHHVEDSDSDEQGQVPLHHKRAFGSGLKRKKVEFVRAQDPDDYISSLPGTTPSNSAVGDLYARIVLGSHSSSQTKDAASATDQGMASTIKDDDGPVALDDTLAGEKTKLVSAELDTCAVCSLPVTTAVREHEALLAHQISVAHSHPPSALDRSRIGLRTLASQGWDPDARVGLGREGREGVRYPIKVAAKADRLGVGAVVPAAVVAAQERAAEEEERQKQRRKRQRSLSARERRAQAAEERQKAEWFQAEMYGRQDLDKYLKRDGKEWE